MFQDPFFQVLLGEFLGCVVLILLGGGVVAGSVLERSKAQNAGWIAITAGWGCAVMLGIYVAKSVGSPQADLNPAITLVKFLIHYTYTWQEVFCLFFVQTAGCFVGAVLVWLAYFPHWQHTSDHEVKRAVFCTSPAIRLTWANFFTEALGTAMLVLGVAAIFGRATQGAPLPIAGPYLVGILVWAIGLSLGGPTGYAINPARDFGPRLAYALLPIAGKGPAGWRYAWVPIVGPFVGGIVGGILWKFFLA